MKKVSMNKRTITIIALFGIVFLLMMPAAVNAAQESYSNPYKENGSKKGLMIHNGMLSDVEELGINEAFISIPLGQLLSNEPTDYSYEYNGRIYYFRDVVGDYDVVIKKLSDAGINISVSFINPYEEGYEYLIYPEAQKNDNTYYYAFNTVTSEGKDAIEAACHYIAGRYNGGQRGLISNYIVGNEVNDNEAYNYTGEMEIEQYVSVYYQTFKTMYNALREENPDANVYVPLEQRWTTKNTDKDYAGKDFLEIFDSLSKQDGNLYWNLAYHPYSCPIINRNVLMDNWLLVDADGVVVESGAVTDSPYTKIITMKNIEALTDYMRTDNMLNKDGNVRSIILSEQGYTSYIPDGDVDEKLQAASIAYAYYKAEMNPYIDSFILNGQLDSTKENSYMKFGLWNGVWDAENGEFEATTRKYAYRMYKYIDTSESLKVTEFALKTLGISSWDAVIDDFDADKFSRMKTIDNGQMYSVESMDSAVGATILSKGVTDGTMSAAGEPEEEHSFWKPGYNIHALSFHNHNKDDVEGTARFFPLGTIVADGNCQTLSYQTVYHTFDTPIDLNDEPYIGFTVNFMPHYSAGDKDKLVLRVRIYSGSSIYDANCEVDVNKDSNVFVNLSDWEYRNSVDKIAVWVKENNSDKSFDGVYTICNFTKAAGLNGAKKQACVVNTTWYDRAEDVPDSVFNPTLYGIRDYSAVYDMDYYYDNNSDVRDSVGYNPLLLLEHFVQKGIPQGRQGNEEFNVEIYKNNYPDISKVFVDDLKMYYEHYISLGKDEGRNASEIIVPEDDEDEDLKDDEKEDEEEPEEEEFEEPEPTVPYIMDGVDYAFVFNPEYYIKYNPDVVSALGSDTDVLLKHFVDYGMSEGRQAAKRFSVTVYKACNKDIVEEFGDDTGAYYMHYINYGRAEGRRASGSIPNDGQGENQENTSDDNQGGSQDSIPAGNYVVDGLDYSAVFNADYYYKKNRDVADVFGKDADALFGHFVNHGMSEGRQACSEFNFKVYKTSNTDVAGALGDDTVAYYIHYIKYGKAEGRKASGSTQSGSQSGYVIDGADYSLVFDADYYYEHNTDVARLFGKNEDLLFKHFVNYGMSEGRRASEAFNVTIYKACNADIANVYGDNTAAYYTHYVKYGKAEGRRCR